MVKKILARDYSVHIFICSRIEDEMWIHSVKKIILGFGTHAGQYANHAHHAWSYQPTPRSKINIKSPRHLADTNKIISDHQDVEVCCFVVLCPSCPWSGPQRGWLLHQQGVPEVPVHCRFGHAWPTGVPGLLQGNDVMTNYCCHRIFSWC